MSVRSLIDSGSINLKDCDNLYNAKYDGTGTLIHQDTGNAYYFGCTTTSTTNPITLTGSTTKTGGTDYDPQYLMVAYADGSVLFPTSYGTVVTATNKDLFIDEGGMIGAEPSLRRYKTVVDKKDYSSLLYKLNIVSYIRKDDKYQTINPGMIAEEVEEIDSTFCEYNDIANPPGIIDSKYVRKPSVWELSGIKYSKFVCPLIDTVQKQKKEIDLMKKEIADLKILFTNLAK